jgi:hypothetical protein
MYEAEFTKRATTQGWWVCQTGSGPEWEATRERYIMTASAMAAMWNGAGYERTNHALDRIVDGARKVFDRYTQIMLDEGKRMEESVIKTLVAEFWGIATWKLSPGVFEVVIGNVNVGASPDGVLWLERHQIPIEVKWHAKGECKIPLPVGYFAQLYTQMRATRATVGLYLGMAPSGEMWGTVLARSPTVDLEFDKRMDWFMEQVKQRRAGKRTARYPDEVDALQQLRDRCVIWKQADLSGLREFLVQRVKWDDVRGNTDIFDLERNAVERTESYSERDSPCALPLPRRTSSPAGLARSRSRSSSPRKRRVPEGIVRADVVEGDEEMEGERE